MIFVCKDCHKEIKDKPSRPRIRCEKCHHSSPEVKAFFRSIAPFKPGNVPWNKGIKTGIRTRGFEGMKHTKEDLEKMSKAKKGVKFSVEHRMNMGKKQQDHWNWQGGITPLNDKARSSLEYKLWRKSVFKRDNYTCVLCGHASKGDIQADHIKQFAYFPELRFDVNNGRTLCISCHKKTDTYLRRLSI